MLLVVQSRGPSMSFSCLFGWMLVIVATLLRLFYSLRERNDDDDVSVSKIDTCNIDEEMWVNLSCGVCVVCFSSYGFSLCLLHIQCRGIHEWCPVCWQRNWWWWYWWYADAYDEHVASEPPLARLWFWMGQITWQYDCKVFPCPSACYRYLLSIRPLKKSIVQRQEKNIFICRIIYSQLLFMGLNCWHSMCKAVLKCVFSVFLSLWGYDVLWVICLDMLLLSLNGVSVAVNVYSGSLKGYNCLWCAKRSFQQLLTKTFLDVTKYFNRGPLQFSILFAVSTGKNAY